MSSAAFSRKRDRDPTPPPRSRSPSRSPPRKRKRPGAASRISTADLEAARARQAEREAADSRAAAALMTQRGVHDVVKQHYNAVPERGRVWRRTDSKIRGLRSFNNWVKSALIQKFAPDEDFAARRGRRRVPGAVYEEQQRSGGGEGGEEEGLRVLDIGCGKGGDLMKWNAAPQPVDLYIGMDPADVSIRQARDRYAQMTSRQRPRGRGRPLFHAEFFTRDCFGEWMGEEPIPEVLRQVGFDRALGMDGRGAVSQRWEERGFDVVAMMFCMHYAFESEFKARTMLRNCAASLKKGGRFLGVIPNSDVLSDKAEQHNRKNAKKAPNEYDSDEDWDPEKTLDIEEEKEDEDEDGEVKEEGFEWGNGIYRVKFPGKTPADGVFRPPFGWKYFYFLEEAVEEVPEYVVPWEAFRALALEFNLELQYRKPFNEIWDEEKEDPDLGPLSERMGVRGERQGKLLVSPDEMEAAGFYHAFCFYKTGP